MARSERYISPSQEELNRQTKAIEDAKQFARDKLELLRQALRRVKKADLIELTLRVAQVEKASEWMLEHELELEKPIGLAVNDIKLAIDIATKVDERRLNYDLAYDWRAYEAVRLGLLQLIANGDNEEAKRLAVELMDKGTNQMECTDEGLVQGDIESCLRPVISAVADLPGSPKWALKMLTFDRIGCLCEHELRELAMRDHEFSE